MCPSYDSITNTFDMTDDVFQGTSRMLTIISNDTNTNNVLDLGTDHWTTDKGYPGAFCRCIRCNAANWHAESGSGSSHKYYNRRLELLSFDYDNEYAGGGAATSADIGGMNHFRLVWNRKRQCFTVYILENGYVRRNIRRYCRRYIWNLCS